MHCIAFLSRLLFRPDYVGLLCIDEHTFFFGACRRPACMHACMPSFNCNQQRLSLSLSFFWFIHASGWVSNNGLWKESWPVTCFGFSATNLTTRVFVCAFCVTGRDSLSIISDGLRLVLKISEDLDGFFFRRCIETQKRPKYW